MVSATMGAIHHKEDLEAITENRVQYLSSSWGTSAFTGENLWAFDCSVSYTSFNKVFIIAIVST